MDMLGIFKNIIKNDYIYEIEKILEKKGITNEIKSLVMDTLFKIEETYPNYKRIKVDVLEKRDYIREIVVALKKVDNIYIMNMQEKDILKCVTDTKIEKNSRGYYDIQIYHNNLSLLYALQTIINEEYGINEQPCSSSFDKILKIGGIYSNIEILRDFSGWNWNRNKIKNFNIYYDIIYRNLLLILGIDKMIELKKTRQCIHFMKKYLLKKYKNDNVEKLMEILKEIVFVMSSEEEKKLEIEANKKIIDMYMAMKDIKKFMQKVNEEKKKNNKLIAEYDKILNSHNVLEREYEEYLKSIEEKKEKTQKVSLNLDKMMDALDNNDASKLLKTLTTIRGNKIELVGGTLPSNPVAPVGKVFSHWVNAETGQKFDGNAEFTKEVTDVYAVYKDKQTEPPAKPPVKNDNKAKNPNTGDNSPMALYVAVLTSTLLVLTLGIRLRHRA